MSEEESEMESEDEERIIVSSPGWRDTSLNNAVDMVDKEIAAKRSKQATRQLIPRQKKAVDNSREVPDYARAIDGAVKDGF